MLISIQEISKATAIPETTIRRYIQVFNDILPAGTKLGRTKKYPPEMADTIKIIHASYQDGLSTVEIQGKLSDTDMAELVEQTETTTLPPQETASLQADIQALTVAVKDLTDAIKLLPPYYNDISTVVPDSPEEIPIPTTTETPHNHNTTTTETQEAQEPGIVENKMDLSVSPPQNHHDATELESPEEELFSSTTTEPPDNHEDTTTEVPEDHGTIETSYNHDTTTVPTPVEEEPTAEPEPEQVIEPHEPTQAELFPETEEGEEPAPETEQDQEEENPEPAQVETEQVEASEDPKPEQVSMETEDVIEEPASVQTGEAAQEPNIEDRDAELIRIYESLPGRENAQARVDALTAAGVYIKGSVWTKKNAGDAYRKAKKKRQA